MINNKLLKNVLSKRQIKALNLWLPIVSGALGIAFHLVRFWLLWINLLQ